MSQAHASDVEALRNLQFALDRFGYGGHTVLTSMHRSIQNTREMLDARLRYWEIQLNEREREYSACRAWTDSQGRRRDCSAEAARVRTAYDSLDHVRRWVRLVDEADANYQKETAAFRKLLDTDCRSAQTFLATRIESIEEFSGGSA